MVSTRVVVLFACGCPVTVAGFVVAIVVLPFKSVFRRWLCAHVRVEVGKVAPPLADSYPASAVTLIARILRVRAALYHARPRAVFW